MKPLIITGCNGQLGRAINQQLASHPDYELINTDVAELDITNIDQCLALARKVKPYAIINCTQTNAKMVHVSTDYVFDGFGNKPLLEFDPTNPQGMYGATKLAGENFVKDFAKDYFIIRTAWLYGENFVKTMLRLSETNDKVRVVGDQFGTPTSADELAKAICYLLPTENYGIFHGTCEGSCNWAEFAEEIFRLAGRDTKVEKITTEEFGAPAPRPAYSVLENYMFKLTTDFAFADWHDAIEAYMKTL